MKISLRDELRAHLDGSDIGPDIDISAGESKISTGGIAIEHQLTQFQREILAKIKTVQRVIKIPAPRQRPVGGKHAWSPAHTDSFLRIIGNVGWYDSRLIRNCPLFDGFDESYLERKFLELAETILRS